MTRPPIHSKTRSQLRRELQLAVAISKPRKQAAALAESTDAQETSEKNLLGESEKEGI